MTNLVLPDSVQREILKEKWADQRAEVLALVPELLDFEDPVCKEWNDSGLLTDIDPGLRLARARPKAFNALLPVRPGFYHWLCYADSAPPTVAPITNADDGWCEPDHSLLDLIRSNDMRDPRVMADLIGAQTEREERIKREKHQDHEDRVEQIIDKYKALSTASVSMNTDSPWTQTASGRRGRKA